MKKLFLILALVLPVLLSAQQYSLPDLLDLAYQNNTTLKQSILDVEKARLSLSRVRVGYFPELSGNIGHTEDLYINERSSQSMGFSLSKNIALKNQSYFSTKNAQHSLTLAEISNEMTVNRTINDIIKSYLTVLESQKRIAITEEDIRIQENIVEESKLLLRQGRINPLQMQQSEILLLNARISLLRDQNNLNAIRKDLFDKINITDEGYELSEVDMYVQVGTKHISREIDFDQILSVRQQNERMNSHRTSMAQSRFDFFPSLNLSYRYGRSRSSDDWSFETLNDPSHTISVGLSYTLNDFFRTRYSYKIDKITAEQQDMNTADMLRNIQNQFDKLLEELHYREQMQDLQQSRLEQARSNLEMARQRHRLGLLTQLELDRATKDYLEANLDLENNHYLIIRNKLDIDYLLTNGL